FRSSMSFVDGAITSSTIHMVLPPGICGLSNFIACNDPNFFDSVNFRDSIQLRSGIQGYRYLLGRRLGDSSRPHRRCWTAGSDLGERWPSRLVATAAADGLSDCREQSRDLVR